MSKPAMKCPTCQVGYMDKRGCGCWGCDICGTLLRPHFDSAQRKERTLLGYFMLEDDLDFQWNVEDL